MLYCIVNNDCYVTFGSYYDSLIYAENGILIDLIFVTRG